MCQEILAKVTGIHGIQFSRNATLQSVLGLTEIRCSFSISNFPFWQVFLFIALEQQ